METIIKFFTDGDIWGTIIKVLVTAILTGMAGLIGTLIGKLIVKFKNSKVYKYAEACVKAAEQKFPNEGKKMGPEKMQYVMDQLFIKFPKIKDNRFLYNIAEAAVYNLNDEKKQQQAILEFKEKYGEDPLILTQNSPIQNKIEENIPSNVDEALNGTSNEESKDSSTEIDNALTNNVKPKKKNSLISF